MARLEIEIDPVAYRFIEDDYRNVIFVANNLGITAEAVSRLNVAAGDVVVQFNRALFFNLFASYSCHKVHIFNANQDASYWGFSKQGEPERDYQAQAAVSFTFYFTNWVSEKAKSFIASLSGTALGGPLNLEWEPNHFHYPAPKKPSVGFQALCYFKVINSIRILCKKKPLKLTLFGFSGEYPPSHWEGHEFSFEQSVYNTWLELVRLDHHGEHVNLKKSC